MKRFYELMRWLYPAAYIELNIQSDQEGSQYFIDVVRFLMNSGREEGFFLAIQCMNEDRINFTLAIRNEARIQRYPEAAKKPTKLCELVLASSKASQILLEPDSLSRDEKLQLRERLRPAVECSLPTLLWASFCDLKSYISMSNISAPRRMAELLCCYILTFLPDEKELIVSSRVGDFIQCLYPRQSLFGFPQQSASRKKYSRITEARRQALDELNGADLDHQTMVRE
jgi:hypothetical protein